MQWTAQTRLSRERGTRRGKAAVAQGAVVQLWKPPKVTKVLKPEALDTWEVLGDAWESGLSVWCGLRQKRQVRCSGGAGGETGRKMKGKPDPRRGVFDGGCFVVLGEKRSLYVCRQEVRSEKKRH